MKEMLLLGAGASIEAGVPGAFDMTRAIAENFRRSPVLKRHSAVVSFVVGGLLFKQGIKGNDPLSSGVNVEELFNAVHLLSERNTIEAAPFVGSWHSMVEEFDKISPPEARVGRLSRIIYEGVAREIMKATPRSAPAFGGGDIDRNLLSTIQKTVEAMLKNRSPSISSSNSVSRAVGDYVIKITRDWTDKLKHSTGSNFELEREFEKLGNQVPKPGEGRIFEEVGEEMIRALVDIVWISDASKVTHLTPMIHQARQQQQLCVASLNYDNGVELMAESTGVSCSTGIDEWSKTGSFDANASILLLKLHGSIDWAAQPAQNLERPMPHTVISRMQPTQLLANGFRPAVIFGHRNKLTAEGPFLDLLRAFRRELMSVNLLTIIGYSFGDAHINEYVSQWLNSDARNRLRIVNPSFAAIDNDYAGQLRQHAKSRIEIISERAGPGLQRIYGQPIAALASSNALADPVSTVSSPGIAIADAEAPAPDIST